MPIMETTGSITGRVTVKEEGEPLPGVLVTIIGDPGSRTTITNEEGRYRLLDLSPGAYSLTAELEGFNTVKESNIEVRLGQTTVKNIAMQLAAIHG